MAQKKKILVVEDDEAVLKPLALALRAEGFDVKIAEDGEKGIAAFYESLPDLILLDLILPKINGFEVLKKIRIDAALHKIPIIILSNLAREGEIKKGLAEGAEEYIVKTNFSLQHLLEKVRGHF
jgi:DNA-binding response OmpR family regulator